MFLLDTLFLGGDVKPPHKSFGKFADFLLDGDHAGLVAPISRHAIPNRGTIQARIPEWFKIVAHVQARVYTTNFVLNSGWFINGYQWFFHAVYSSDSAWIFSFWRISPCTCLPPLKMPMINHIRIWHDLATWPVQRPAASSAKGQSWPQGYATALPLEICFLTFSENGVPRKLTVDSWRLFSRDRCNFGARPMFQTNQKGLSWLSS